MARSILTRVVAGAASALFLAACTTAPNSIPTEIRLSATSVSLDAIGATESITASVVDQQGKTMNTTAVWSSNSAIVTVQSTGNTATLTAAGTGSAVITVTAGLLQGTVNVQVVQVPVAPVKISGDLQTGPVGSVLGVPLQVRVVDRLGAPIPNQTVIFAVTQGGGITSSPSVSQSDGVAASTWTLGTAVGVAQQASASLGNGLSTTFTATAQAGPPAQLVVNVGQGQTATVGTAVSIPPAVQVRDGFGNLLPGVTVNFTVVSGGGTVSGGSVVTDAGGVARVGSWSLGTAAGPNTLGVSVAGLPTLSFSATALPGPAATVLIQAGQNQSAAAGSPVPVPPSVRVSDQFGNPVAGVPVGFAVTGGGGSVTGATPLTGANGIATVGSWILGGVPGPNTLTATVGTLPPVQFTATGLPVPASVAVNAGNNQSSPVGTPVPVPPSVIVRDAGGNPVAGVIVTFAVTGGGGSATGTSASTGPDGIATVGSWNLGPSPGSNTLTATVPGLPVVTFTATATGGGIPATVIVSGGSAQFATAGSAPAVLPSVLVRDVSGQVVPGVAVTFAITRGSGTLTGANAVTGTNGIATLGGWTLGPGVNCVSATVAGSGVSGNPVSFVATGIPPVGAGYEITVQYLSCATSAQEAAFTNAVARWGASITGDVIDVLVSGIGTGSCGSNAPAINNRTIDDLLIFATIEPIDGPGRVLGQAGPCFIRTPSNLPIVGLMRFDVADIDALQANGRLTDVILHEMGHVIGIGTMWTTFGMLQTPSPVGGPAQDTHLNGANAIQGFNNIGGSTYTGGNKVPVENMFSSGTINAHWREGVLANELMTGFLNTGSANPLSELTVRSLADFGYVVNPAAADGFHLTLALRYEGTPEVLLELVNDVFAGPIYRIDTRGRVIRVR